MYKKWEKKIIATRDCSITCQPNILQQLLHQNYTGTDIRLRHWGGGGELVERQGQLHACIHTGGVWGECVSSEKLKILYF